ncbi:MAG: Holliday junction branch migration protein RuvA [Chlamydiae bacterium]|nr:MAG: Holliday junction branch migration protein RuvA [Chlamydiota bacterium]
MFDYLKATLIESSPLKVTVEVHGIGYRIWVPIHIQLPQKGCLITLYVSPIIREDSHQLFGFLTRLERDFFELLITISGVGPKIALCLMGHLELPDLHTAILQGNIQVLSKTPGIGKKTAERLIIELRDKVKTLNLPISSTNNNNQMQSDALSALIHLGYPSIQAQKAIKVVLDQLKEPDLGQLITAALKHI